MKFEQKDLSVSSDNSKLQQFKETSVAVAVQQNNLNN